MSSIDEQFVEFVVKSLVNNPDQVKVERRIDEKGVLLELTVDPEDLGRVIGKRGATAQSIRTLLRALGTKNDARYNLKIVDNSDGSHSHQRSDDRAMPMTDNSSDDSAVDNTADEPMNDDQMDDQVPDEEPTEPEEPESDGTSDRLSRTRQELEDLDDLDV